MIHCFAYVRVSGFGQLEGDGFTRQLTTISTWAAKNGYLIDFVYKEEAVSGKTELENRPALSRLFDDLGTVKVVLIEKMDRLARDLIIQETIIADLAKRDLRVISVMEPDLCSKDPSRVLIRQIMGAIAQYEHALINYRMRSARERIRSTGQRCEGQKPYGERPEEQPVISIIGDMRDSGCSLKTIAQTLNDMGKKARHGKAWYPMQIKRVLERRERAQLKSAIELVSGDTFLDESVPEVDT